MAEKSKIEWTDATAQVASGCDPVSEGCKFCYSARLAGTRLKHLPRTAALTKRTADGHFVFNGTVRFHDDQAEKSALKALADVFPRGLSKEEVAALAGYEPTGGGFNNALSRLRTLELIEGRGELRASEALFG